MLTRYFIFNLLLPSVFSIFFGYIIDIIVFKNMSLSSLWNILSLSSIGMCLYFLVYNFIKDFWKPKFSTLTREDIEKMTSGKIRGDKFTYNNDRIFFYKPRGSGMHHNLDFIEYSTEQMLREYKDLTLDFLPINTVKVTINVQIIGNYKLHIKQPGKDIVLSQSSRDVDIELETNATNKILRVQLEKVGSGDPNITISVKSFKI